ncbi:DUF2723 domain-containing protein [Sphingobacterium sp. CZ-2]|uniref:glycosyltransferase family 117 protein n=1 Tax=Sphingobacterium sp. CZ-2 TaxID=2557994 RepID=UPI00106F261C|nr:DUF2723 domain-containing protein [Sphingobacterium sp. CZ-2]QBR13370.1 DUF2723 domain-containing protein [Sphingobacterium sp. CZ-2]
MNYSKINNLLGWLCGIIATTVYILTTEHSSSWWDTGEFIASAYKLEIVHQPGAPLFLMLQNLFSNLAFGDTEKIAFWMNVGSAVCSGLTIVFLFWTITAIARKVLVRGYEEVSQDHQLKIFSAGLIGALAYSFTDSFWYSAVESEVYAMSSLCTAVVFWLALKWERRADEPDANKWLLVLAYVMGLSIGVHLLNLLTIPAIALLIYFRKTPQVKWSGILKSLGWGVLVLALILWGVIQYSVKIAAQFDLFFVNGLGMPFGSGIYFFVALLTGGLVFGIYYSIKKSKPILNLALLSLGFIYMGFGSYGLLMVRSHTNISLNNNAPDNVFSFLGYLSREQYQSEPLFKGPNFDSRIIGVKEEGSNYRKDAKTYTKIGGRNSYEYDKEVLFPRIYHKDHEAFYRSYLGLREGESPTFADNMKFFFQYQIGHMYSRYFMWNFVGRQNDQPSQGEYYAGNWISGISFLDDLRIPGQAHLSEYFKQDPSRNTYFFLPLILGVVGLLWQLKKSKRDAAIVGLLFFFTGLAIVLYLNQSPLQPRERDYAYAGSFYVFSIWIGLGFLAILEFIQQRVKLPARQLTVATAGLCMFLGPILLVTQNWDDHDRSARMMTKEMAYNALQSCEPNAILFTYSDNDTFPLWYLQEVEGVRTDVRVLNHGYLQSDWYVKQAMQDINQSKAIPVGFGFDKVKKGVRDYIRVLDMGIEGHVDLDQMLAIMLSDDQANKVQLQDGTFENVLPSQKLRLKINKEAVLANSVVPKSWEGYIPEYMEWDYKQNYVSRAELAIMSILNENNWERPIYFTTMSPNSIFMGMDKYLANEGMLLKLMPVEVGQPADDTSLVNTEKLYSNVMEKFKWSDISTLDHFDTDSNKFYENWVFSNVYQQGIAQLMQQENFEHARNLALKAYDFQPKVNRSMRLSYLNGTVVDTLYKTKELEKANSLAKRNLQTIDELLNEQLLISKRSLGGADGYMIQLGLAALKNYEGILGSAKDESLLAEVKRMGDKYNSVWM